MLHHDRAEEDENEKEMIEEEVLQKRIVDCSNDETDGCEVGLDTRILS